MAGQAEHNSDDMGGTDTAGATHREEGRVEDGGSRARARTRPGLGPGPGPEPA